MIQFFGLHLGRASASAAVLGRDLDVWARSTAAVINAVEDPRAGVVEVPCAEWVRAGAYALQEAYFQLPASARKAWGLALAGPSGWVALDVAFEPISPLRLTPGEAGLEDLRRWIDDNPRLATKVAAVLSPKDYFRFVMSRGLAADVTSASRWGLLQEGASQWSDEKVSRQGLRMDWLPPVFDSHVPTGRLSEEGMRRSSLPGGFWLVAGAHETEAALLAGGDLRDGRLRVMASAGGRPLLAYGVEGLGPVAAPGGWSLRRSAMSGHQVLERPAEVPDPAGPIEQVAAAVEPHRRALEEAGFAVRGIAVSTGAPEVGAAALAGIGSGLVKGWDQYYRARKEPP
jgi:sugar (pentulose or hexulose) kinase